jgi:ubiquinone/menaquinone biosynthesis C-methylase UbiE
MKDISAVNTKKYENFYGHFNLQRFCYEIFYRSRCAKNIAYKLNAITGNVIDIGFGCGETLKLFNKANMYGIELSENSRRSLSKLFPSANLIIQDLNKKTKLKYKSNFFDMVILLHVLEHIKNYKGLLKEIYRISSEKSFIIMAIPVNEKKRNKTHFHKIEEKNLTLFLKKLGFKIVLIKRNLHIPPLPPVYDCKKGINLLSLFLNFLLSLNYTILIIIDKLFGLLMKPRQCFIVCGKVMHSE